MTTTWPVTWASLAARGALATGTLTLSGIARCSLRLAQVSLVVDNDFEAAQKHLVYPILGGHPNFREISNAVAEGKTGMRPWNGQLLEFGSQLERLLCFILSGRFDELASDYAACFEQDIFSPGDDSWALPRLTKQLLLAATSRYDQMSFENWEKSRGNGKSNFFHGYERLLQALAGTEARRFEEELAVLAAGFIRRARSRRQDDTWGYGYRNMGCFDTLGTAICLLGRRKGLVFPSPVPRVFPLAFVVRADA